MYNSYEMLVKTLVRHFPIEVSIHNEGVDYYCRSRNTWAPVCSGIILSLCIAHFCRRRFVIARFISEYRNTYKFFFLPSFNQRDSIVTIGALFPPLVIAFWYLYSDVTQKCTHIYTYRLHNNAYVLAVNEN